MYDVIIVGGGPAGLTAAIYTSRAGLKTLILEAMMVGGNAALTDHIDNFPGFPFGVKGSDLMDKFLQQAQRFGAQLEMEEVTGIVDLGQHKKIITYDNEYLARAVIITTGARRRELKVPGEEQYQGRGVSYCATCDGAFFVNAPVAVVGGGDSALTEAIFLSRLASKVFLIHRRDQFRASPFLVKALESKERIELKLNSVVKCIEGNSVMKQVVIQNTITGQEEILNVEGLFVSIGLEASAPFLQGFLETEDGYVVTDSNLNTSVKGIFAAGDIRAKNARQVATAVGDGALAGMSVVDYLSEQNQ
ncbi:MAG: thioredoxin-disulfide reductase [Syntrophomonadaceae bacterium]